MTLRKDTFQISIKPFDMNKISKQSIVVLLGKRMTGKSYLVKDILYHKRDIPLGMVISMTDHIVHYYDKFIPSMFIHSKYDPDLIAKLFKRQEKALHEGWKDPHAFLLFDDCLSESKTWSKDEKIKEIFFNGRHYKLLFLLTMQSPMGIPPEFRTNIDFTFILKNNNENDREKIYKNYAGVFPSREIFNNVFDACTEDHHCLVIDNTTQSNNIEDQVFIYKARPHDNLKLCPEQAWAINNSRYTQSAKTHSNERVITTKRNQKIIIKKRRM